MSPIKRLLFGGATITPWVADAGLTILRVFAGLAMALAHGWGKLPVQDGFVDNVGQMGFPVPALFAWAAALSEFLGGLLLAAGLVTRAAAFFVLSTMAVAGFIAHADDPFLTKERALLFGAVALAFVCVGAGRYSVDRFLR